MTRVDKAGVVGHPAILPTTQTEQAKAVKAGVNRTKGLFEAASADRNIYRK